MHNSTTISRLVLTQELMRRLVLSMTALPRLLFVALEVNGCPGAKVVGFEIGKRESLCFSPMRSYHV
jgi:hypothetical protein